MKNVKELSEIRALKILSAAQNNESAWPIFLYWLILHTVIGMLT